MSDRSNDRDRVRFEMTLLSWLRDKHYHSEELSRLCSTGREKVRRALKRLETAGRVRVVSDGWALTLSEANACKRTLRVTGQVRDLPPVPYPTPEVGFFGPA